MVGMHRTLVIFVWFLCVCLSQSLTQDVNRQKEREKQLQSRFGQLQSHVDDLARTVYLAGEKADDAEEGDDDDDIRRAGNSSSSDSDSSDEDAAAVVKASDGTEPSGAVTESAVAAVNGHDAVEDSEMEDQTMSVV